MHRQPLLERLNRHVPADAAEEHMRQRILTFVREHEECFERTLEVGHITGSAWVVSHDLEQVLLLHHGKLDRWLQPGGHSDGDPATWEVALREVQEETGLTDVHFVAPDRITTNPVQETADQQPIFDVDVHAIPARGTEPEHEHHDIRFLLLADANEELTISHESNDLQWVALERVEELTDEESVLRMLRKTRRLRDRR